MVEGVVFNASGAPQAGALVAGGLALVQTDANGFFRSVGVPAGPRRIEAGDPVTRRRGSAEIVVLPGQTVSAAVRLEARATITGRVLDANGNAGAARHGPHPEPGRLYVRLRQRQRRVPLPGYAARRLPDSGAWPVEGVAHLVHGGQRLRPGRRIHRRRHTGWHWRVGDAVVRRQERRPRGVSGRRSHVSQRRRVTARRPAHGATSAASDGTGRGSFRTRPLPLPTSGSWRRAPSLAEPSTATAVQSAP